MRWFVPLLLVCVSWTNLCAQQNTNPPPEEKGTYLGVLFSPVPEVLYAQVPKLSRECGILVNFVLPDSPAAIAGLKRYDIILEYDGKKVRDCECFARLVRDDAPERLVKLLYLRSGEEHSTKALLVLGPALKIVEDAKEIPRGGAKPIPGGVSVSVKPLEGGLVNVLFEYVEENTGILRSVPCNRKKPVEVDIEIDKLPEKVQSLARSAWSQVRDKMEKKTTATPQK